MASEASEIVYGIVGNIPKSYRSSHLRNYFSQFVESGGFECFHFKHRPESRMVNPAAAADARLSRVGAGSAPCDQREPATTCCIVKIKRVNLRRLVRLYSRKHWMDDEGNSVPSLCIVAEIDLKDGSFGGTEQQKQQRTFTAADLKSLPELKPPPLMPQGNVGTPTKHFLELIRACRLPSQVIKSLGLRFPSQRRNKKYGCVPYDYSACGAVKPSGTPGGDKIASIYNNEASADNYTDEQDMGDRDVFTAAGHVLHKEGDVDSAATNLPTDDGTDDIERKYMDPDSESGEEDDDTCEDWERHEALHDDAGNYERNEERLFEEKIELKWEKGGSGLVFYTDAQVWQKAEGDFDEQTADDWDVDMSVYYDEDGGDKDARDSVAMRKERRLRLGIDDDDGVPRTGAFERYTKGVGRRLLMQNGWRDGGRLGKTVPGLAEALECDGQHPRDKKGFGYLGERVNRYCGNVKRLRQSKEGLPIITTVYDNPKETDPQDTLLRRQNPHNLKYRTSYGAAAFVPASKDASE